MKCENCNSRKVEHYDVDAEAEMASTADFLNTCLRESGLGRTQVGAANLKPGIDALFLRNVTLEERVRVLLDEFAVAVEHHAAEHGRCESWLAAENAKAAAAPGGRP